MRLKSKFALSLLTLAVIAVVHMGLTQSAAQQPEKNEPPKKQKKAAETKLQALMRQKLGAANNILEGLTTDDFTLITKGSKALAKISSEEKWRISNDAIYRQHSNEFQRKIQRLGRAAKEEKLDAAALTYIEVTMSCIECHKWVRAMLMADHKAITP